MRKGTFFRRKSFLASSIRMLDIFAISALLIIFVLVGTQIAMAKSNKSSVDFVQNASIGGAFEVQSSQLALDRSQNSDIRAFAQNMVDDHTAASEKLMALLPNTDVPAAQIKGGLDSKHQKMLDKLTADKDTDFDSDYIAAQKKAHKEAVGLFKDYAKSGEDATLKDFATQTLPTLQGHQDMVKKLKAR